MDKIQYLHQQALRAERLARNVMDALTVERLSAFAAECRDQVALLDDGQALRGQEPARPLISDLRPIEAACPPCAGA